MPTKKSKKNIRQRGYKTHGWGSKKKHRGSGNRGGKGMAGTGKRGDSKKPSINVRTYFGKNGFVKKNPRNIKELRINDLEQNLDKLLAGKLIEQKSGTYVIDLKKLGYNKILGNGIITKKMIITVEYASSRAVEKVKKAGGDVILPQVKKEAKTVVKEEGEEESTEEEAEKKEEA